MGKLIICLSGLTGAGKSTVARMLKRKYQFPMFSVGHILRNKARAQGIRTNKYSQKLVAEGGPEAPMESLIPDMQAMIANKSGIVIEGFYREVDLAVIARAFPEDHIQFHIVKRPKQNRVKGVMKRQKLQKEEAGALVERRDHHRLHEFNIKLLEPYADRITVNTFSSPQALCEAFEKGLKSTLISRIMQGVVSKKSDQTRKKARKQRQKRK